MSPGPMVGGMQPTEDSLRDAVCMAAMAELEAWPSDPAAQRARVREIWHTVIQDPNVAEQMVGKAWCGAFALFCLKSAFLADNIFWIPGIGFLERHCAHTTDPKPGDIAYFAEPFQHHAVVMGVTADRFDSVDGNQPGISRHLSRFKRSAAFYSIAPLIQAAMKEVADGTG